MSDPEADRRNVQQQMQVNPNMTHVHAHEVGSHDRAGIINAEIDRIRQEQQNKS